MILELSDLDQGDQAFFFFFSDNPRWPNYVGHETIHIDLKSRRLVHN